VFGDQRPALIQRALQLIQVEFEPRTLQAFWQATVEGRQTADIAADLEMTIKAVRQAKYRVMRRLRQELDELL
jgi:RNA polymerase sigma-70 factor (ECF subfamily)